MKQRRYLLKPLDETKGDLCPYERRNLNGNVHYIDASPERCMSINTANFALYFCLDWLPSTLLPLSECDDWCQSVVNYFKTKKTYGARERRSAEKTV